MVLEAALADRPDAAKPDSAAFQLVDDSLSGLLETGGLQVTVLEAGPRIGGRARVSASIKGEYASPAPAHRALAACMAGSIPSHCAAATPAASATSLSPRRRLSIARCSATREEEQAAALAQQVHVAPGPE